MRAKHFIIEYSREKTAQVHGANILSALDKNKTPGRDLDVWNLMSSAKDAMNLYTAEERADFMNKVMAQIEQGDPTKNKEYSQWIARMYSRGGYELEDIKSTLRDALETYHKLKLKKKLEDQDKQIDKFKSFNDLITRVNQYPEIEDDAPTDKGDSKQIYDDEHIRVIVPKNVEAACYYGQGTRWCTASKNNNMFKLYNKEGDMYIIIPKKPKTPGEKYQFHFHSGQFMDASDSEVDMYEVVKRYPTLRNIKTITEWAKRKNVPALMSDEDYAQWKKETDASIINNRVMHDDMYTISLNQPGNSMDDWRVSSTTIATLIEKSMMVSEDWSQFSGNDFVAYGWFDAKSNKCLGVTILDFYENNKNLPMDVAKTISDSDFGDSEISNEPEVKKLEKFFKGFARIEKEKNSGSSLADEAYNKAVNQLLDSYGYPMSVTGYVGGEPQRA